MRPFALALVLAACGGGTDIDETIVFADRSDEEIARLISAASGTDMFGAQTQVNRFASEDDACPAISVSGQTVTLTGGCTTLDGVVVEGTAKVTNPPSFDEVDFNFTDDTEYELTGWTLTQSGFAMAYDGRVTIESFTTYDADVTVTQLGVTVRSDLYFDCDTSSCDLDGSGVELVGVGGATVSGTVQINNAGSATYRLRGRDTLTVSTSQGCVAWAIDGTERAKVCR